MKSRKNCISKIFSRVISNVYTNSLFETILNKNCFICANNSLRGITHHPSIDHPLNIFNSVNSFNSYSAVLPPSTMVFLFLLWVFNNHVTLGCCSFLLGVLAFGLYLNNNLNYRYNSTGGCATSMLLLLFS